MSVPSTWSIWTGPEVWVTGKVWPSSIVSALGVPGLTSMKLLPSKKIRGRTLSVASSCSGRPSSFILIVTLVAGESPPTGSTFETLPTSTPAIRTAVPCCSGGTFSNTALTSNGRVNGTSLLNARKVPIAITISAIAPAWKAVKRPRRPSRFTASPPPPTRSSPSGRRSRVPWLPGGLPITVCPIG